MKYIFENIIQTNDIYLIINEHFEDVKEREHITNVVRDIVHHKLVDMVLDELDREQKLYFLKFIEDEEKHQSLLEKLREWVVGFEEKLHLKAREAESEILQLFDVA